MTMKRILFFTAILLSSHLLFAQGREGSGKVSGSVIDSESGEPIEYATIALNDIESGSPLDGTVADDKGRFTLTRIADGKYSLVISFIGYEPNEIPIEIINGNNINVG